MPGLTVTPKYARTRPLQLVCPDSTVTTSMPGLKRASDTGHKARKNATLACKSSKRQPLGGGRRSPCRFRFKQNTQWSLRSLTLDASRMRAPRRVLVLPRLYYSTIYTVVIPCKSTCKLPIARRRRNNFTLECRIYSSLHHFH